ncbi:hypothetical protein MKZ38_002446 [Zalerion maritima]|uniref:Uncharacterized protein n=1 Tax=Zalerion maritima TaxID=339359 RepID=A0AAD5WRA4_9PEZI|nr:hypothetical protein MKZ38_002446 [Zalerion maritima]
MFSSQEIPEYVLLGFYTDKVEDSKGIDQDNRTDNFEHDLDVLGGYCLVSLLTEKGNCDTPAYNPALHSSLAIMMRGTRRAQTPTNRRRGDGENAGTETKFHEDSETNKNLTAAHFALYELGTVCTIELQFRVVKASLVT